jgi:signal transduction histidine kinase
LAQHLAQGRDSSQKDNLEAVARACKRLVRTCNAVLDYSKLESRPFPVKLRAVPLIPLMRRLIEELEPQASQKGLKPGFGFEETGAAATIDEYCLKAFAA